MTSTILDFDLLAIVALLPIAAMMVVTQRNPYHALVVRGILGAISALVYALLGAADVALTEALVGTMLAVTLYMVAVRSSLVLQLGVLVEPSIEPSVERSDVAERVQSTQFPSSTPSSELSELLGLPNRTESSEFAKPSAPSELHAPLEALLTEVRRFCRQHFLRLELVTYNDRDALYTALEHREVHAIGTPYPTDSTSHSTTNSTSHSTSHSTGGTPPYIVTVRVQRLYDLMQTELNPAIVALHLALSVEASAHNTQPPKLSTP